VQHDREISCATNREGASGGNDSRELGGHGSPGRHGRKGGSSLRWRAAAVNREEEWLWRLGVGMKIFRMQGRAAHIYRGEIRVGFLMGQMGWTGFGPKHSIGCANYFLE
jgi:hypothetical protein